MSIIPDNQNHSVSLGLQSQHLKLVLFSVIGNVCLRPNWNPTDRSVSRQTLPSAMILRVRPSQMRRQKTKEV